jgi:hypothetical protein
MPAQLPVDVLDIAHAPALFQCPLLPAVPPSQAARIASTAQELAKERATTEALRTALRAATYK